MNSEIVRRGFYVPGVDKPSVFFQGEQLPDEAKRLLDEHEHHLLQAFMHLEVTPEFWEEETRRITECYDSDEKTTAPLLSLCLKTWVEECGWFCAGFPQVSRVRLKAMSEVRHAAASGKLLIYVAGGV